MLKIDVTVETNDIYTFVERYKQLVNIFGFFQIKVFIKGDFINTYNENECIMSWMQVKKERHGVILYKEKQRIAEYVFDMQKPEQDMLFKIMVNDSIE